MASSATKTDSALWEKVKKQITDGDRGGEAGQWSARKAQLAVAEYKKAGGGYRGRKSPDNHLKQWTEEDWGTKSGAESGKSGERYLPKQAREALSDGEHARTTAKKRRDTAAGKQFSKQPEDVAKKAAKARATGGGAAPTRKAAASEAAPAKKPAAARKAKTAKPAAKSPAAKSKATPKRTPAAAKARRPQAASKHAKQGAEA